MSGYAIVTFLLICSVLFIAYAAFVVHNRRR